MHSSYCCLEVMLQGWLLGLQVRLFARKRRFVSVPFYTRSGSGGELVARQFMNRLRCIFMLSNGTHVPFQAGRLFNLTTGIMGLRIRHDQSQANWKLAKQK